MGWEADPFGIHELRYFSQGQPTRLVKDGKVEAYDEPPTGGTPNPAPPPPPPMPGATAARVSMPPHGREVTIAPTSAPPPPPPDAARPLLPDPVAGEPPLLAQFRASHMAIPSGRAPLAHADPAPASTASNGSPNGRHPEPAAHGPYGTPTAPPAPAPRSPGPTASAGPSSRPHHVRARAVSRVFKMASWVVLGLGLILGIVAGASVHGHGSSGGSSVLAAVAVIGASVLGAAALAFFACALDLLMAIDDNTRP